MSDAPTINEAAIAEEIEALEAIFGPALTFPDDSSRRHLRVAVTCTFIVLLVLPDAYPAEAPVVIVVKGSSAGVAEALAAWDADLSGGCFGLISQLQEQQEEEAPEESGAASELDGGRPPEEVEREKREREEQSMVDSQARAAARAAAQAKTARAAIGVRVPNWYLSRPPSHPSLLPTVKVFVGPNVTEKKSVFQARVALVRNLDEVEACQAEMLSERRCCQSTHNIAAYRFEDLKGKMRFENDDDGESAAGSRLAELLTRAGAKNVWVCVSRWYGGTQLGPLRFKVINKVAADALADHGLLERAS